MGSHGPDRPRVDDSTIAEPGGGYGALTGRPRVRVSRTDTPPEIDGRLDDEVWRTAAMLSEFVQQSPLDGAPATEDTELYIAYDSEHIYFAFYLHYSDPSLMRASRVDRDTAWQDDLVTVYLDTFMDQQVCYDFDLNAYNVQGDGIISANQAEGGAIPFADRSWEALFYSGTQIVEDGYTAEMAIPFKSFRYPERPPGVEHRWGLQIVREIKGKNQESVVWAPMSRDVQSFMAQMGVLEGMTDLSTSRNLEILPSFTAIQYSSIDRETGDFVNRGTDPEGGVNVKYGITSNLTADFTGNPDFLQIESDLPQIEVNQRFPLFLPELRPFFLEGAEIFEFVSPVDLVHTRTLVDPNTGAKLTGKVGNTTLGVMVTDDEAPGKRDDPNDPGYGRNAQVAIGRARYDLYSESHIGALVTDREFLDGYNRVGGIDGQFRLGQATRLNFVAFQSQDRDEQGVEREGPMLGAMVAHEGRNQVFRSAHRPGLPHRRRIPPARGPAARGRQRGVVELDDAGASVVEQRGERRAERFGIDERGAHPHVLAKVGQETTDHVDPGRRPAGCVDGIRDPPHDVRAARSVQAHVQAVLAIYTGQHLVVHARCLQLLFAEEVDDAGYLAVGECPQSREMLVFRVVVPEVLPLPVRAVHPAIAASREHDSGVPRIGELLPKRQDAAPGSARLVNERGGARPAGVVKHGLVE